jgi:tRNA 2-thiouridine synthesizing protein A
MPKRVRWNNSDSQAVSNSMNVPAVTTEPRGEQAITAESLIDDLRRLDDRVCPDCGGAFCHHEALMSLAMGFKGTPRCLGCLAKSLGRDVHGLRDHLFGYIRRRDCYLGAWEWATEAEGFAADRRPACLFQDGAPAGDEHGDHATPAPDHDESPPAVDAEWDAGDMSCGDLVLELRLRLQALPPRQVLKLSARDTGAREDLPAWCRLTGHTLLRAAHPDYWIQRKD